MDQEALTERLRVNVIAMTMITTRGMMKRQGEGGVAEVKVTDHAPLVVSVTTCLPAQLADREMRMTMDIVRSLVLNFDYL